ncbi:hypothetical protein EYF80_034226 [Liparis tanakae]|uniref:Uncharacterized protein n=1 Tax=Liparis tanakae TaxID=230148 RepID=A0A4Z2GPH2_9TELE|nr:hypothetical protein EYF80_034226 [Liparis tanakae]
MWITETITKYNNNVDDRLGSGEEEGGKEMDIKWPSESVVAALRANYQANGVNARDEMGSGDE